MRRKGSEGRHAPKTTTAASRATKDKVLHARIPEQLDEELRTHAQRLGLSVSTIVRNVLLHTFDLVEGVVTDTAELARAFRPARFAAPDAARAGREVEEEADDSRVLGWQEAMLNVNAVCEHCNTILHKGTRAALGVPVRARPVVLCASCLTGLESVARDTDALGEVSPSAARPPPRRTR